MDKKEKYKNKYVHDTPPGFLSSVTRVYVRDFVFVYLILLKGEAFISKVNLAAGSIKNRIKFIGNLKLIPRLTEIPPDEVLDFIETRKLHGKGLSWIDLQLLAAALVAECDLLTFDETLNKTFRSLVKR